MNSLESNTKVTFTNKGLLCLHDDMPIDAVREPDVNMLASCCHACYVIVMRWLL